MENGANFSIGDPKWGGLDVVHILASVGQKKTLKLISKINPHLDFNEYHDEDGLLPLHRACLGMEKGHMEIVRFLCQEYRQHGHGYGHSDHPHVDVNSKVLSTPTSRSHGYAGKTCLELTKNEDTKRYILDFMRVRGMPMGDEL
mmetsp:Transcript_17508/g.23371  ORF Transcript_17508/g.23371 Transcript_17508/m.23371 type:complete len:144 (+) Transcript_17508:681-1112(+)